MRRPAALLTLATALLLLVPTPLAQGGRPQGSHAKHQRLERLVGKPDLQVLELRLAGTPDAAMTSLALGTFGRATSHDLLLVRLDLDADWDEHTDVIARGLASLHGSVTTVAFVERKATRAGALIALSAEFVAMAPEATIGWPDTTGQDAANVLPDDVAWLVGRFNQVSQLLEHDREMCLAIVDPSVELYENALGGQVELMTPAQLSALGAAPGPRVTGKGDRLHLTGERARAYGLVHETCVEPSILWDLWNLDVAQATDATAGLRESIVSRFGSPYAVMLIVALGLLGVYVELITPGLGAPGFIGAALLLFALYIQWAIGAAELLEVMLIVGGLLLLMLEIVAIPGFGVAGISGLLCLALGALLCLQSFTYPQHTWQHDLLARNALVLLGALSVFIVGALTFMRFAPHMPLTRRLALNDQLDAEHGYTVAEPSDQTLVGRHGLAHTPLRPAGRVELDGALHDVVCDGEFIARGDAVVVRRVEGNRIVVERLVRGI